MTDCYQAIEINYGLTRGCLEVCRDYRNPVSIVTKSPLIERDIELLRPGIAHNSCLLIEGDLSGEVDGPPGPGNHGVGVPDGLCHVWWVDDEVFVHRLLLWGLVVRDEPTVYLSTP